MNAFVMILEFLICFILPFVDTAMENKSSYFWKASRTFLNISYSNIAPVSALHCCSTCNNDKRCRAVNYQRVTGQCFLLTDTAAAGDTAPSADWDTYRKIGCKFISVV